MICPNCGTENANNLAACEKCGESFESVSSSTFAEQSDMKKFAKLIAIRILVYSVIAVVELALFLGFPFYQFYTNGDAALATCKNFSTAAKDYFCSEQECYWEDGTTDFIPYFSHVSVKSAFNFKYFSNDRDGDGIHEATKFIYFAVPVSYSKGQEAIFVDERGCVFLADVNEKEIEILNAVKSEDIFWRVIGANRLIKSKVVFTDPKE